MCVRSELNGDTADGDEATLHTNRKVSVSYSYGLDGTFTHDVVVLAAHGGRRAGVAASDADDGDGGAGEADKDVQVLEDNTKQAEDRSRACIASLNNRLW